MLIDSHLRHVGLLLSEVARPRPCTTAESAWISGVLGALGAQDQRDFELVMRAEGPELVGSGARAGVVVRYEHRETVLVDGEWTARAESADAAALMLLQRLAHEAATSAS